MTDASQPPSQRQYETHWIELVGAHNVRDVAGLSAGEHRVRPGVLYRSDHLDALTDDDLAIVREQLGLGAVVDLRSNAEAPTAPRWLEPMGVARLHLPLIDLSGTTKREGLREQFANDPALAYQAMLAEAGPGIVAILAFVLEDGHRPVMIHCAAGKDRTGITVAVLLAAAGVDEPDIVADYVATGERLPRIQAALAAQAFYKHVGERGPEHSVAPHAIAAVLDVLREHEGGPIGFLLAHGATAEQIDRWRALIVDDAG